jgi:hypothetical protein
MVMTRRKRAKPYDPAEAERIRQEREARREMAEAIARQPDVVVNRDPRTGAMVSAMRRNCFALLLKPLSPEEQAVNWFELLVRQSRGEADRRFDDGIRAANDCWSGHGPSDAMLIAADKLAVVRAFMPAKSYALLLALVEPDAGMGANWRHHVLSIYREVNPVAQGARVKAAAEVLAWVWDNFPLLERAHGRRAA